MPWNQGGTVAAAQVRKGRLRRPPERSKKDPETAVLGRLWTLLRPFSTLFGKSAVSHILGAKSGIATGGCPKKTLFTVF